jgi:hypothetical protein
MRTCLFTGEALTPTTKEEHTIPRSLGGRIRSREVTCDDCNNRCGSYLDKTLHAPYALILNKLEPLMASEHESGPVPVRVPGEPDGIILDGGGVAVRRKMAVLAKDPETGRPTAAVAPQEEALRNLARRLGKENSLRLSTVPTTEADTFFGDFPVILAELEIGALRSALLTFDHALRQAADPFTRRPELQAVRSFVAQSLRTRQIDGEGCHRFSLGMQYEQLPLYRELRRAIPFPETPFEHVLLVATNAPRRCLDLVWLVLGFDPFGFRLSTDWWGDDFALGLVSGVLRGTTSSAAVSLPVPLDPLCRPTSRRSFADVMPEGEERERVYEEVSRRRHDAYGEAVLLVEERADDLLRENFTESALLSSADARQVGTQVRARLVRMYGRRKDDPSFLAAVEECYGRLTKDQPGTLLRQRIDTDAGAAVVDWPAWLGVYRACLLELRGRFGLPGDPFTNRTTSGVEAVDSRRLGELPPARDAGTNG